MKEIGRISKNRIEIIVAEMEAALTYAESLGIQWNVSENEPGYFFMYASDEMIHKALSQPNAPVSVGDFPYESANRLKDWLATLCFCCTSFVNYKYL